MNRPILVCALLFVATAALGAQEASQSSAYQGISTPPPDDTIVTTGPPQAKPRAGRLAVPVQAQAQVQARVQSSSVDPAVNDSDPDGGMVALRQSAPAPQQPALIERSYAPDPDGDIVHPRPSGPGALPER